jgi:hypothetical protein
MSRNEPAIATTTLVACGLATESTVPGRNLRADPGRRWTVREILDDGD